MSKTHETKPVDREERISAVAYAIWEEQGCPQGQDEAHWHMAVERVNAELSAAARPNPDWLRHKPTAKAVEPMPPKATNGTFIPAKVA